MGGRKRESKNYQHIGEVFTFQNRRKELKSSDINLQTPKAVTTSSTNPRMHFSVLSPHIYMGYSILLITSETQL